MKMNKIIFFLVLINLISCKNDQIAKYKLTEIECSEIKIAELKKGLYDTICVPLTKKQIEKVCELINSKQNTELQKIFPKYWLFIKLENNSIRKYKIAKNCFGENDAYIKVKTEENIINFYQDSLKTKCKIDVRTQ